MSENSTTPNMKAPVDKAIPRQNLVEQAYQAIRDMISTGRLAPGWQLKIDALSKELEVSGTPIREALRRLEHDRWIEVIPFRGAFVRAINAKEIEELYEIRLFLETAAVRKAMPCITPDALALLEAAAAEIRDVLAKGDQIGYMKADIHFHEIIVGMADNERLSQMYSTLADQGRCFLVGRTSEVMIHSQQEVDQHDRLLEAIRGGQSREAIRLLEQHLRISRNDLQKLSPSDRRTK